MIPTDKVASFTIDHTKLFSGVYVARECRGVTTFDVRIVNPNREPIIYGPALHSIEHMLAVFFRNSEVKDDVCAVDGMMCCTGMYILMFHKSDGTAYTPEDIRQLLIRAIDWTLQQTEVPATTKQTCGAYLYHDLDMCKWYLQEYRNRLVNDFHCEYTKLQVVLSDGRVFQDS